MEGIKTHGYNPKKSFFDLVPYIIGKFFYSLWEKQGWHQKGRGVGSHWRAPVIKVETGAPRLDILETRGGEKFHVKYEKFWRTGVCVRFKFFAIHWGLARLERILDLEDFAD